MKTWGLGYQKSKEKAKEIYSKIGRIQCPALNNEYISFTSAGFSHLIRKGRIPRSKNEQKKRFVLIPFIESVIKNPRAKILFKRQEARDITNRHGDKILIKSIADFWTFVEEINGCIIKVVIRQLEGKNQKHFLSVMGNDVLIDNKKKFKNKKSSKKRVL